MWRCRLCRYEFVLDDVKLLFVDGRCVCVRCYDEAVKDQHPMSDRLRRWIEEVTRNA